MSDSPTASLANPSRPPGYVELVRSNRDFRNLWFGQIVSLFGDWFNLIASAALIAELSGSGLAIGGLFVVRMLAPFVVSPFAGVAADRYNRKHLLIGADIVRAVVVLGFLSVRAPEDLWLVYVLTAAQLGMHGLFFPTRNAILPDIVSPSELGTANALASTTWSTMLAFGAAAGGLVAGGWGIYPAFIIDCLTFLLSAVLIARVTYRPSEAMLGRRIRDAFSEYFDGFRYLSKEPDVLFIAVQKAALCLFVAGGYEVLQVSIAKDNFVIGEGGGIGLGLLYAALGVGSGVGPILARRFTGDRPIPMCVAILAGYGTMIVGLTIVSTLASFPVALVGAVVRAMGGGTIWVFSTQLMLQRVPNEFRGRVFSMEFALLTLAMATGAAISGWGLDHPKLGVPGLLMWMSALTALPMLAWGAWLVRRRGELVVGS